MRQLFLFILIGSFCMVAACKKKSTTTGQTMTALFSNNTTWRSTNASVSLEKNNGTRLVITADSAGSRMTLSIRNYTGVGKYIISDSGNTASYADLNGQLHNATSGEIKVDTATSNGTNTNNFRGSFNFLAGSVQINAGTYNVNLYLN